MIPAQQRNSGAPSAGAPPAARPDGAGLDPCRACTTARAGAHGDHRSLYQQLLAGLYDAVLVTDPNGYVIDTNPRVAEFFQYSAGETWDRMVGDLISGINAALLERVRKGLEEGRFILLDAKCVRKDGSSFAGEVSISSIRLVNGGDLVFAVRNVDRRKNAWQKLKSGRNAWMKALAPGVISDADGMVRCVNRAGLALWGCAAEEDLVGKPFTRLWADADAAAAALAAAQAGAAWKGELRTLARGGRSLRADVALEPEPGDRGGSVDILCSVLPAEKD